ncbi:MAG: hypothetical protein BroJett030_04110 [Alphaproteobacteria bacterium]|nr:MAG: hypothetical protein BroJett030_04110 [Alphaproteobacteria bacterium]
MHTARLAAAAPMLAMVGATACQAIDETRTTTPAAQPPVAAPAPARQWPPQSYTEIVGGWTLTDDQGTSCLVVFGAAAATETTLLAQGSNCPVQVAEWAYEAPSLHLYSAGKRQLGTLRATQNETSFAGELRVSGNRKTVRLQPAERSAN